MWSAFFKEQICSLAIEKEKSTGKDGGISMVKLSQSQNKGNCKGMWQVPVIWCISPRATGRGEEAKGSFRWHQGGGFQLPPTRPPPAIVPRLSGVGGSTSYFFLANDYKGVRVALVWRVPGNLREVSRLQGSSCSSGFLIRLREVT